MCVCVVWIIMVRHWLFANQHGSIADHNQSSRTSSPITRYRAEHHKLMHILIECPVQYMWVWSVANHTCACSYLTHVRTCMRTVMANKHSSASRSLSKKRHVAGYISSLSSTLSIQSNNRACACLRSTSSCTHVSVNCNGYQAIFQF